MLGGVGVTPAAVERGREARYVRAGAVLWRRTAATVVVLAGADDEVFELAGTAVALWEELTEPATVEAVAAALGDRYGVAAEVVAPDVAAAMDELVGRGVVDVVGGR